MTTNIENFVFDNNNTFCISLDSSVERRQRISKRFQYFGLNVTFWSASTPDSVSNKCADFLNSGQRACAQSHMNIWKNIVEKRLQYAFVMEDDACFDKHWKQKLEDFFQQKKDWDMILLNCSDIVEPSFSWQRVREQYLTGAYIISLNGARKLVDMFGWQLSAADWMTSRLQLRGKCYSFFPWLVVQEGTESTIGSGFVEDHLKVLRCLDDIEYEMDNYV